MYRFSFLAVAAVATLVSACSASSEKDANREYVNAAQKVASAAKSFNEADYSSADKLCREAFAAVQSVIEKYPDSAIALKVVTDRDLRIGPCTYVDLFERVIPSLDKYSLEVFEPANLAWTIAVSQKDEAARDLALDTLAQKVLAAKPTDRISVERLSDMCDACVLEIKSAPLKSRILAERAALADAPREKSASPDMKSNMLMQKSSPAPVEKISDEAAFLAKAESDAKLVAYELRAVSNLRAMALQAKASSPKIIGEFKKSLDLALENIMKISSAKVREVALADMTAAYANIGDISKSVEIAKTLETPEIFSGVFQDIAEQASREKNYTAAIGLASKIPNEGEKSAFLCSLAAGVAEQGLFAEAVEISKMLKDVPSRNLANANIAKEAFAAGNGKVFIEAISRIDVSDLSALDVFNVDVEDFESPAAKDSMRLATLASVAVAEDKDVAEALNNLAIEAINSPLSKTEFAKVSSLIAANYADMGKASEAVDFLINNIHLSDGKLAFDNLCAVAEKISVQNKDLAASAFKVAANICESFNDDWKVKSVVSLAWTMQHSGMDKSSSAKILSAFLPKF